MKKKLLWKIMITYIFIFTVSYSNSLQKINFNYPLGITSLTVEKMLEKSTIEGKEINYNLEKNSTVLINSILKGEAELAIVPSTLVGVITEKKLPYSVLGTVGWGSFYILGYERINSIKELNGKEIGINGKNLTPDLVLKNILQKTGVVEQKISYYPTPNDVATMLLSRKIVYGAVPEPLVSNILKKDPELKIVFSFNEEWKKLYTEDLGYPQSMLIVKNSILEKEKEFVNSFLNSYKESMEFLIEHPESSIYTKENLDLQNIKRFNLKFISGKKSFNSFEKFMKIVEGKNIDEKIFK